MRTMASRKKSAFHTESAELKGFNLGINTAASHSTMKTVVTIVGTARQTTKGYIMYRLDTQKLLTNQKNTYQKQNQPSQNQQMQFKNCIEC